jgi:hypothetical protein
VIRPEEPAGVGPRFSAGTVVITAGARALLTDADIRKAFVSHIFGNWGEVCAEDAAANERALADGERILSVYRSAAGVKFYVITEADRLHTVVLLPEEY